MKSKFATSLNKNNETLKKIFKTICRFGEKGSRRLSMPKFEAFLAVRYPDEFISSIAKYFSFGEGVSIESYISEFEKLLSMSDDRLLHFVFEAFDTNHDNYLCYADTFLMIAQRKADTYDRDLVKLRQMFYLKKSRNSPGRKTNAGGRRPSFSGGGEEEETKFKRKRVPYYNLDKPEALTFEDFSRVEFGGKPQFLWDFLKYTCGIETQETNAPINSFLSRQSTEEILEEASLSSAALVLLAKDERAGYFKELVSARQQDVISQHTHTESHVILGKFRMLRESRTARKMISKESIIAGFVRPTQTKFFGAHCDYLAERFYDLLSGSKSVTVTKPRFCRKAFQLLQSAELLRMKLEFKLYDSQRDGVISVDELYDMQTSLPPDSRAYHECSR
jgi:Ca2+-binding EF-hand superfamily protein